MGRIVEVGGLGLRLRLPKYSVRSWLSRLGGFMETLSRRNRWAQCLKRAVFIGAMAFGLAACGESINPFSKDVIEVGCPAIGALKEAEELTRFRDGAGRDLTDVRFEVRIGRTVGKCKVNQSKLLAEVNAGIELFAERGPALDRAVEPLEYFIAIQAPKGEIATRQSFTVDIDFSKGLQEIREVDYLTFEIPNATAENLRSYKVYFGIQMTQLEWDYALQARNRRR